MKPTATPSLLMRMGRALTARIHPNHIDLFADAQLVATHERRGPQSGRFIIPAHFEAAFRTKPRGRGMVYRDWLCRLSPCVERYIAEVSHKRRAEVQPQMSALYELAQEVGLTDFVAALELAAEQHMYGAEYVRGILSAPSEVSHEQAAHGVALQLRQLSPAQAVVERDLAQYEQYVANREQLACTPEGR